MRRRSFAVDLADLDLEIETTCRRNNAERHRNFLQERAVPILEEHQSSESSSRFPKTRESKTAVPEVDIMAEEQPRRVTLEDYSSSTVPWFFTRIA